jgi:cytochrome oxidase Cu insertion factor (SCO1/SenC/PrrC family)
MDKRTFTTILMAGLLLIASTPLSSAYKGHQLSRAEVLDFTLTDQNNENFTFSKSLSDVHVVAFIFTRCIDVCPVITQSLKLVQDGLSESDAEEVQFLSISVDPRHDTPERLLEFTNLHGVEWPHLTGDSELMVDVYNSFGVNVQEDVIEAHISNSDPTVTYLDTSGNATELMFEPSGWTMNEIIAEEANWTINATFGQNGHVVKAINGVESPIDSSWSWSLKTFNESSETWQDSMLGIDDIDALENQHLVWAASNANTSVLSPHPMNESNVSIQILYPDNTTVNHSLQTDFNAYHLTKGAFAGVGMNTSFSNHPEWGHALEAFDDVNSPSDWSWYWALYSWNTTADGWEESMVGVDDMVDPGYIAWAPSTVNISEIPMPESLRPINEMGPIVCNGNGWEMGSGEGKHCMCEEGYDWAEDDRLSCVNNGEMEIEFSVGHTTITYIMDGMKPKVAWTGDSWKADDLRADLEEVISSQSSSSDSEGALPGMTLLAAVSGLSLAAIIVHIRSSDEEDEEDEA